MAKAKQLPSGAWRVQVYSHSEIIVQPDGSTKRVPKYKSFTGATKKEAEFMAATFAYKRKTDSRSADYGQMTVKEAITSYIDSKSNILAGDTIREYKRSCARDMQSIMNIKIDDLTAEQIQTCFNIEAMTHSPKTVRNMHGLLSAALSVYAPTMRLTTTLPQKTKPKLHVPTDVEIKALIAGIRGTSLEVPVLLAAFGSLRRSEICALEGHDISGNTITISKAMVKDDKKEWIIKAPKSYAGYRVIELPQAVIDRLPKTDGRVASILPGTITKQFNVMLRRLGIPHFRFHDLRHYQASILHALNVPDKYIMERGGWSTDSTLKNVYQHTLDDKSKEFSKIANDYFSSIISHDISHVKDKTQ